MKKNLNKRLERRLINQNELNKMLDKNKNMKKDIRQ